MDIFSGSDTHGQATGGHLYRYIKEDLVAHDDSETRFTIDTNYARQSSARRSSSTYRISLYFLAGLLTDICLQDAQVASHYLENKTDFDKTARYWTEVYAHGDAQLAEMSDEN